MSKEVIRRTLFIIIKLTSGDEFISYKERHFGHLIISPNTIRPYNLYVRSDNGVLVVWHRMQRLQKRNELHNQQCTCRFQLWVYLPNDMSMKYVLQRLMFPHSFELNILDKYLHIRIDTGFISWYWFINIYWTQCLKIVYSRFCFRCVFTMFSKGDLLTACARCENVRTHRAAWRGGAGRAETARTGAPPCTSEASHGRDLIHYNVSLQTQLFFATKVLNNNICRF